MVVSLIDTQQPLDTKMSTSELQLIRDSVPLTNDDKETRRRKVDFEPQGGSDGDSEKSDSEDEDHVQTVKRKTLRGITTSSEDDSSDHSENESMELSAGTRQKVRKSKQPKENKRPYTSSINFESENSDTGNTEYEAEDEDNHEIEDEDDNKYENEDCDVNEFLDIEAEEGEEYDEMSWEEDEQSETESDIILEESQETVKVKKTKMLPEDEVSYTDNDITDDDNSKVSGHLRWKENLTEKASRSFKNHFHKTAALKKLVYGGHDIETERDEESKEDMELGGLFHVRDVAIKRQRQSLYHQMDTSLSKLSLSRDWSLEDNATTVKHLFVTGDWRELDARALLEEDGAMYGDFEDLETGEYHIGEEERKDERQKKKRELKKAFDDEYDQQDEVCNRKIIVMY